MANNYNKKSKKTSAGKVITWICVILVFAFFLGLCCIGWIADSGIIERCTTVMSTDNYSVNNAMMTYYFNSSYQNFVNSYGDYLSSFGLDTGTDLKEQTSIDGSSTWYDYFMDAAKTQAEQALILCEAAKAEGVELDADDMKEVNATIKSFEDAAAKYGYGTSAYIKLIYGSRVSVKDMKDCIKLATLASKYATIVSERYEYTSEDYETYYEDNIDTYRLVDILKYSFTVEADDDGAYDSEEMATNNNYAIELASTTSEDEFKEYVRSYLYAKAEAELDPDSGATVDETTIDTSVEGLLTEGATLSAVGEDAGEWAFNAAVGETKLVSDEENGTYTVYYLVTAPYRNEYATKNGAYIYLTNDNNTDADGAKAKADEIVAEWETSDKSEETFLDMVSEYTEGTVLTDIEKDIDKSEDYADYLYEDGRVAGDVGTVVTDDGVYVVYYSGEGLTKWIADVDEALRNADYEEEYTTMQENYAVTTADDKISVIPISMSSSSSN